MRGIDEVMAARLSGLQVARIDIDLTGAAPAAGLEMAGGVLVGVLIADDIDTAPRCDLRCVRGLHVVIFGDEYRRSMQFLDACMEHGAQRVSMLCSDDVVTFDGEKVREWAM